MREHTILCDFPEGCSCGATKWNSLEKDRDDAVRFATKIERGDITFTRLCNHELKRISELPLEKTNNESLADAIERVLNERNFYKSILDKL